MRPVALFFTPGMSRGVYQAADPLARAGYDVRFVSIPGRSSGFVGLAQECGVGGGPILPCVLQKYAPDVPADAPVVAASCFSAGCWAIMEGLLVHPADREKLELAVFIDGYHARGARAARMRAALEEGMPALVIHSDTPTPPSYPSTTESVEGLKPWPSSLTVVHRPGGHDWRTLQAGEAIADYLGVARPAPYATFKVPHGRPPVTTPSGPPPELGAVARGGPLALMVGLLATVAVVKKYFRKR